MPCRPDAACVMAAILAHASNVPVYIRDWDRNGRMADPATGSARRPGEPNADPPRPSPCARVAFARSGQYRPTLRDRIDPAFSVTRVPSGEPSSNQARRYQPPSHRFARWHRAAGPTRCKQRSAKAGHRAAVRVAEIASALHRGRSRARHFRLCRGADQVHAIVPVSRSHQRQAVLSKAQAALDGAHAVFDTESRLFATRSRQVVVRILVGIRARRPSRKVYRSRRARRCRRSSRHSDTSQRQPQKIVRTMGAYAAPDGGCHQC